MTDSNVRPKVDYAALYGAFIDKVSAPDRYVMPTVVRVRPIAREIAAEPDEVNDWGKQTMRMRYEVLTDELPLAGGSAMRRMPSGELSVIAALRAEAPWLEDVIAIVERQLELQLAVGRPWVRIAPLLLVGAPGTGKSWIARRIAELCGCGHGTADLSGAMDATIITGNPRGWMHCQPVFPALVMAQAHTANPFLIVEEVDKAGGSERYGDPIAAMLNLIEPSNARCYYDKALLTEIDVSHANWVMTANAVTPRLPKPFLSRVEVVGVAAPPLDMFEPLVAQLIATLAERWSLPSDMTPVLPTSAIATLRADYRRHRSIRRLGQMIERVAGSCLPERRLH